VAGGSLHANIDIAPAGQVLEVLVVDCHGGRRKRRTHAKKIAFFESDV
jgi:hypothetical protein